MSKQSIIIYNIPILFDILNEIKENIKFNLYNSSSIGELNHLDKEKLGNYLIVTKQNKEVKNYKKILFIKKFPLKINELLEKININLIKQNYSNQSEISIGKYKININSRKINFKSLNLKLTEREINLILYLHNSKDGQTVENLKKKVWMHNSSLETHTVETHIYRLRKKINDFFGDKNFILSNKNGYKIS